MRREADKLKSDLYKFRIDSFTPDTIPMARLAAYMAELAKLLGNEASVHFREIIRGSAVLVSEVEAVAVPKVRERLTRIDNSAAKWQSDDETLEPCRKLNVMLAADNAIGNLRRGQATILQFPGRESARIKIGPVTQPTTIIGQLVRVGGRDKTAHAQVEDAEGRSWTIVMSRDQARQLAPLLYGDVLRFAGVGRWARTVNGLWELDELRLQSWEAITNESLRDSVQALRQVEGSQWRSIDDPLAILGEIRDGESGVN